MEEDAPVVVGVSGASGAPIALRVIEALRSAHVRVSAVASRAGLQVLKEEAGVDEHELSGRVDRLYADDDFAAAIASGSTSTRGMVVVPCSSSTVAKIALGLGDTLLTRAAHVHLKERRRLIVVPRETPLPTILLRQLTTLSELGVVVLVASPAYYLRPSSVGDVTDYLAGKVLDHLGVAHQLYRGWKEGEA